VIAQDLTQPRRVRGPGSLEQLGVHGHRRELQIHRRAQRLRQVVNALLVSTEFLLDRFEPTTRLDSEVVEPLAEF